MECHFSKGRTDRDSGCPAGPANVAAGQMEEGRGDCCRTLAAGERGRVATAGDAEARGCLLMVVEKATSA